MIFPAPMDAGDHRVNVGIANAGAATQSFMVRALDSSGAVVSSWGEEVGAYAIEQLRTNAGMDGPDREHARDRAATATPTATRRWW